MSLSMNDRWGMYGIVREDDIHTKAPEFYAWCMEVKNT